MLSIEEFKQLISENLGIDKSKLTNETSFLEDLGVDSLSMVNFIIKLELKFQVKIELENVWLLNNVREAHELLIKTINNA